MTHEYTYEILFLGHGRGGGLSAAAAAAAAATGGPSAAKRWKHHGGGGGGHGHHGHHHRSTRRGHLAAVATTHPLGSKTVLPSKFLLGGNIRDPLNLNSLNDEKISKIVNAITPETSPMPTPKHRKPEHKVFFIISFFWP